MNKCPVCYSDIESLRNQVGQAAFLIDLNEPESLCKHLITIQSQPQIVNEKIRLSKDIIESWTDDDFYNASVKTLENYENLNQCWR